MSIIKKFAIGNHRLSVVIPTTHTEWLKPLDDIKNIRNVAGSCNGLFEFMKHTRNFNVSMDSSFHEEVKSCIAQAFALSETLEEFLQNGLLNRFNYTIKVDLVQAFKPIEITVIDGKFSGKYDKAIGYQTTALSSFERNVGAGEDHFLFSPNEFLREPYITLEEANQLSEWHQETLRDDLHSHSKMYAKGNTIEGFLLPNTEEKRKWVKLLVGRVQRRWDKLDLEQRNSLIRKYADNLILNNVTKRFKKTMLLNNTSKVLMSVKPLINILGNTGMLQENKLGLKATLDQTNFVLAIV